MRRCFMGKINFVPAVFAVIFACAAVCGTAYTGPMDNADEFAQQAAESSMGDQMDQESN